MPLTAALPRQRSVLLVDDSSDDVELMRLAIGEIGWKPQLAVAVDGVEAMIDLARKVEANRLPDAVIIDLNMPRVNGWELLAYLGHAGYERVRRVVLTSSAIAEHHRAALELGATRCFVKPYTFEDLLGVVAGIRAAIEAPAA
jgi:chemotaxis family two-component system response regulator Rcp1